MKYGYRNTMSDIDECLNKLIYSYNNLKRDVEVLVSNNLISRDNECELTFILNKLNTQIHDFTNAYIRTKLFRLSFIDRIKILFSKFKK